MRNRETKKELMILMSILVMLIIAIVTFSYKIYAFISQPQEQENNVLIEESKSDDSTIKTVVITEEVEEEKQPEEIIEEENSSNKNNSTAKTTPTKNLPVLTAPNGETYSKIAKINIPSLGIKNDILSHTTTALMKISVTKYWGPEPNEPGNFCVIGHNYRNTRFFSKLKNIKKGAIVQITDSIGRTLEYKVYDMYIVDPSDSTCTSQLNDGHTEITLITCTDDSKQRFIVKARAN